VKKSPKVKITAIVAEFNPLHKGHEYIIGKARKITGASHVLIVQSGNFTQRAEPAIQNKHVRAENAVRAGADAVVEIPAVYATGNAEIFAKASIKIATSFPHVTNIAFGIESDDLSVVKMIATTQVRRERSFEKYMYEHLKKGISFDKARCEVIKKLLPKVPSEILEKTMSTPNNILAIEYIKELVRLKSSVVPIGIQRIKTHSATDIRNYLLHNPTGPMKLSIAPAELAQQCVRSFSAMLEQSSGLAESFIDPVVLGAGFLLKRHFDIFGSQMLFSVMTKLDENIYNSNAELVNLVRNLHPTTYDDLKRNAPTKRFSVSRIARLALHSTLAVTKKDIAHLYENDWLPYTNLLAINMNADALFSALCLNIKTPLVVRGNKIRPKDCAYSRTLKQIDARADLLYESICGQIVEKRPRFVSVSCLVLDYADES